jgi:hypothetical protein
LQRIINTRNNLSIFDIDNYHNADRLLLTKGQHPWRTLKEFMAMKTTAAANYCEVLEAQQHGFRAR